VAQASACDTSAAWKLHTLQCDHTQQLYTLQTDAQTHDMVNVTTTGSKERVSPLRKPALGAETSAMICQALLTLMKIEMQPWQTAKLQVTSDESYSWTMFVFVCVRLILCIRSVRGIREPEPTDTVCCECKLTCLSFAATRYDIRVERTFLISEFR
jgi:hypothetical protein